MIRSGSQLASSGCRMGRSILASRVLGVSPSGSQLKPAGLLLSCAARSSMTSARRGGAYSHHLGVACGASASASRGSLPGRSKLARGAAFGNVDLSMCVFMLMFFEVC